MKSQTIFTLLLLVCLMAACKEEQTPPFNPQDARHLEGHEWTNLTGALHPEWHYCFEGGLLTQRYVEFGATLSTITLPYAIRQDTVYIGGNATNNPRTWVLYFECEDVVQVAEQGPVLSQVFWLKRE